MADIVNKDINPVLPLAEGESEPTPGKGVSKYPGYRYQKIGANITRISVIPRPESQEAIPEPLNVIPFPNNGPKGRKPGGAA